MIKHPKDKLERLLVAKKKEEQRQRQTRVKQDEWSADDGLIGIGHIEEQRPWSG